jgi:Transposase
VTAERDMAWVGIDVGKTHHWACVVDADGKKLLSIKVANDEAAIAALITDAGSQATQLDWAVDIIGAPSALLLALLARADQSVRYASGRGACQMVCVSPVNGRIAGRDDRQRGGFIAG